MRFIPVGAMCWGHGELCAFALGSLPSPSGRVQTAHVQRLCEVPTPLCCPSRHLGLPAQACVKLNEDFRDSKVQKEYYAVLQGELTDPKECVQPITELWRLEAAPDKSTAHIHRHDI